MQIKTWLDNRKTPGTLADVARRMIDRDAKYREIAQTLQSMYVLEALLRNDSDPYKTATAIGVNRITVQRVMRGLRITADDVRKIAARLERSTDAGSRAGDSGNTNQRGDGLPGLQHARESHNGLPKVRRPGALAAGLMADQDSGTRA